MMSTGRCQRQYRRNAAGVRRRRSAGFTMIELAVTIAIAAILTTVAVPSFTGLIASQRAKTAGSELFASLLETRSEAIKRNANVTLSPLNGDWKQGWQILDPANAANVLEFHGALSVNAVTGPAGVTYRPSGRAAAGGATLFLVTTTSGSSTINQCISLNLSGRPYMVAASTC
jgi:type IV fimbrial biogenesis protein FimT